MTATTATATRSGTLAGVFYMCLAVTLLPVMNGMVKLLIQDYPVGQIVWARYAGHLLFIVLAFMPARGWKLFRTQFLKIQIFRSFLLLGSTTLFFTALQFLPLATAAAINFTAPFFVAALAVPMLGERVGPRRWTAVAIGFVGALTIIRPGFEGTHWAAALVVGCAACYALFQVITRRLAGQDDNTTTIAYTAVVGTLGAAAALPFGWVTPANLADLGMFLAIGFLGGFGHFFIIKAFQHAEASVISPLGYGQLIGAVAFGYLVFGNLPDLMTWIGAAIIVACGIYIVHRER